MQHKTLKPKALAWGIRHRVRLVSRGRLLCASLPRERRNARARARAGSIGAFAAFLPMRADAHGDEGAAEGGLIDHPVVCCGRARSKDCEGSVSEVREHTRG